MAILAATFLVVSLLACTAETPPDDPDSEHATRVAALLPTTESASPTDAAVPPTDAPAALGNTPVPPTETPVLPTYTPRPLPTYTPRPAPVPAGERERADAIPFQAQSLDGTEVVLSDTFGTPTLLAFWAPW